MPLVSRLEVITTGARRRWTTEEKRRIVAESHRLPRQVSATARRHGLSASLLFTWRRLAREGRLGEAEEAVGFAPAVIGCDPSMDLPHAAHRFETGDCETGSPSLAPAHGRMEIVLADGRRVIVDRDVDTAALRRVLSVLERQ
jgi:transposase